MGTNQKDRERVAKVIKDKYEGLAEMNEGLRDNKRYLENDLALKMEQIAALEAALKEKDCTPDFARGFRAGQQSVLRTNLSGCCCKWDEKDEGEIVSLCGAHKEYIEKQVVALSSELMKWKATARELNDELALVSRDRDYWRDMATRGGENG